MSGCSTTFYVHVEIQGLFYDLFFSQHVISIMISVVVFMSCKVQPDYVNKYVTYSHTLPFLLPHYYKSREQENRILSHIIIHIFSSFLGICVTEISANLTLHNFFASHWLNQFIKNPYLAGGIIIMQIFLSLRQSDAE